MFFVYFGPTSGLKTLLLFFREEWLCWKWIPPCYWNTFTLTLWETIRHIGWALQVHSKSLCMFPRLLCSVVPDVHCVTPEEAIHVINLPDLNIAVISVWGQSILVQKKLLKFDNVQIYGSVLRERHIFKIWGGKSCELVLTFTVVTRNLEIAFIQIPLGRQYNKVAMCMLLGVRKTRLKDSFIHQLCDLGRNT